MKRCGFTLIEMLVVVLIVGILAAIALPQYETARDKAKFSTVMDLTRTLKSANDRYFLINQKYSLNPADFDVSVNYKSISISETSSTMTFDWGYCRLSPSTYVYCGLNNPRNEYIIYYTGRVRCDAIKNSARAYKLCQVVTNKNVCDDCTSNGSWDIFFF